MMHCKKHIKTHEKAHRLRLDGQQIRSPFVARTKTRAARLLLGFPDASLSMVANGKTPLDHRWFLRLKLKRLLCTNALDMKNNMMIAQNRKGTDLRQGMAGKLFFHINLENLWEVVK